MIKFNQNTWLKPYTDMNIDLRKKAKNDSEKYISKLMNNAIFGKNMENVRKHRDIKLVSTERKKKLFGVRTKWSYYKVLFSDRNEKKKKKPPKILINKPVHLGVWILELSKILICEFCFDYVKQTYGEKAKLCCMDSDSFIVYNGNQMIFIKTLQRMLKQDLIFQIMY